MDFDQKTRTYCPAPCAHACGVVAYVKDNKVLKIEPAPMGRPGDEHICGRGLSSIQGYVHHPDRLKYPLKRVGKRGEGKWQRISWNEALELVCRGLKKVQEQYGPKAVMGFQCLPYHALGSACASRLANLLEYSSANLFTAGDSAGPVANLTSFGNFIGGHESRDALRSKYLIIWGLNPAVTDPRAMRDYLDAREQGTQLVVIDPRFTTTASKADWWIPIRPQTDGALALGMAKVIVDNHLQDEDFLARYTVAPFLVRTDNGLFLREKDLSPAGSNSTLCWNILAEAAEPYEEDSAVPALTGEYLVQGISCKPAYQLLLDHLKNYPSHTVSEITEVPEETIERLALDYASHKPAGIKGWWGLQRAFHGHLNVRAIHLLAALSGNIGKPGGGVSDWTASPVYARPLLSLADKRRAKSISMPAMHNMIQTGKPYPIKAVFTTGSYLTQRANANRILHELWPKLDLMVVFDVFMTPTAEYADIVLPGATSFECTELSTSAFPWLQLGPKLIDPAHECRSDFWVFKSLAQKMGLGEFFYETEEALIEEILKGLQFQGITLADLKNGPIRLIKDSEPHVMFQNKRFLTPSGRMEFYAENHVSLGEALPLHKEPFEINQKEKAKRYPLTFFSTHTRWRHHSCLQNAAPLRELCPEPELEIHPDDAESRGIQDGDVVQVFNDRGRCRVKAKFSHGIRPGVVNIEQGWWANEFLEGSHQELTHDTVNDAQELMGLANMAFLDVRVQVQKA